MTPSEVERLTRVETKLTAVEEGQRRIEAKLDAAIECKADKAEVATLAEAVDKKASAEDFKEMRKLLIGVLLAVAGFTIVTLIGIVLLRLGLQ